MKPGYSDVLFHLEIWRMLGISEVELKEHAYFLTYGSLRMVTCWYTMVFIFPNQWMDLYDYDLSHWR